MHNISTPSGRITQSAEPTRITRITFLSSFLVVYGSRNGRYQLVTTRMNHNVAHYLLIMSYYASWFVTRLHTRSALEAA